MLAELLKIKKFESGIAVGGPEKDKLRFFETTSPSGISIKTVEEVSVIGKTILIPIESEKFHDLATYNCTSMHIAKGEEGNKGDIFERLGVTITFSRWDLQSGDPAYSTSYSEGESYLNIRVAGKEFDKNFDLAGHLQQKGWQFKETER